jgi:hypothetical protein
MSRGLTAHWVSSVTGCTANNPSTFSARSCYFRPGAAGLLTSYWQHRGPGFRLVCFPVICNSFFFTKWTHNGEVATQQWFSAHEQRSGSEQFNKPDVAFFKMREKRLFFFLTDCSCMSFPYQTQVRYPISSYGIFIGLNWAYDVK